ncbi:BRE1 E3 ubiquitin ligase-domain-containing protein [Cercophora scortea]|uniref:E3 ubiquitin protein ligase n=1 Tax=Cercophora scortea TaxID=314031 RepID=A0AAE0IXJ8_9PEZI|nr:BRE1 E3 ubiquitin ligase-domain-containing protein [Cercophora scortea]
MPIATSPALPRPATFTKMEDRKRPAASAVDDVAPPSKRQAVNGSSKARDDSGDMKEEAWIEEYQKGAIYRQMLEYKREKSGLESRLQDVEKNAAYHDDHIRILDAWILQLVQEIELLADSTISTTRTSPDTTPISALAFKDSKDFQKHLGDKQKALVSRVNSIFKRLASARGDIKPEIAQLEAQVRSLLANHKELIVKIDRLEAENTSLSEQYDTATLKVFKAERKLDRVRSAQVQKLEQKALAGATTRPTGSADEVGSSSSATNGDSAQLETQYQELVAVVAKQKEQIASVLSEIKGLQDENATFKAKREAISDEDYARSDVFKQFKGQNEELIRRINNLEATNKQLREDAEKLRAERTAYRVQLETEAQTLASELEDQIQRKDEDLTRIRSARDELLAELAMRKASQEQEKTASAHMKELVEAKADRLAELESELERLRPSPDAAMSAVPEHLEALTVDELREKFVKLEKDFEAINKELPLLEKSYKKAMALAQKRVMDFDSLEERIAVLTAEKSKADQKYFAARKDMDIRTAEIRALRQQNSRSSEIISQLKDVETQNRTLIGTLEKQVADLKQSNTTLMVENKKLESAAADASRRADGVKTQISDLTNLVKAKDASLMAAKEQAMNKETEIERLKVRLSGANKECDKWKQKSQGSSSEEEEMLRNLVLCSVCRSNFKNTILKGCGHVFCNECVDARLANRMRKCPTCNKAFDRSDAMAAHL